jgi:hypothetical protein
MLLFAILDYYRLFHPRLFLAIISNFKIWLLVVIGYSFIRGIGGYFKLNYHKLLMVINEYSIGEYE